MAYIYRCQKISTRPSDSRPTTGPSSFTVRRVCVQLNRSRGCRGLLRPYSSMLLLLLMQRMELIDRLELRSDGGGVGLEGH
jgi:hypothetical protein